jgi:hypothetical protein
MKKPIMTKAYSATTLSLFNYTKDRLKTFNLGLTQPQIYALCNAVKLTANVVLEQEVLLMNEMKSIVKGYNEAI